MPIAARCNGIPNCGDGSDEDCNFQNDERIWYSSNITAHYLPHSKPGYFSVRVGWPNETEGMNVFVSKCPIDAGCLGGDRCAEGMTGFLCHECADGYGRPTFGDVCSKCDTRRDLFTLMFLLVAGAAVAVYFSGVAVKYSVEHDNITAIIFRIVLHHVWVTLLIGEFGHSFSDVLRNLSLPVLLRKSFSCLLHAAGVKRNMEQASVLAFLPILWPGLTLLILWIIVCIRRVLKRKRLSFLQAELDNVHGLIVSCRQLVAEEEKKQPDAKRTGAEFSPVDAMAHKNRTFRAMCMLEDFERYYDKLIYDSRVFRVWSSLTIPDEDSSCFPGPYSFLRESTNFFIFYWSLAYSFVLPPVLGSVWRYEASEGGPGLVKSSPEVEFLSDEHSLHFGVAVVCLAVYGIGYPVSIFVVISKHAHHLMTQAVSCKYGFLYMGYLMGKPMCYWEIYLLFQKLCVSVLAEKLFEPQSRHMLNVVLAISAVVIHGIVSPFENLHYSVLDHLKDYSTFSWCLTAIIIDVKLNIGSLGGSMEVLQWTAIACHFFIFFVAAHELHREFRRSVFRWAMKARVLGELDKEFKDEDQDEEDRRQVDDDDEEDRVEKKFWRSVSSGHWNEDAGFFTKHVLGLLMRLVYMSAVVQQQKKLFITVSARVKATETRQAADLLVKELKFSNHRIQMALPKQSPDKQIMPHHSSAMNMDEAIRIRKQVGRIGMGFKPQAPAGGLDSPRIASLTSYARAVSTSAHGFLDSLQKLAEFPEDDDIHAHKAAVAAQLAGETKEREVFCNTLIEALRNMIVTHDMTDFPYCILEFIMYDAIYYTRFGLYLEPQRPGVLMQHIAQHTKGPDAKKILKAMAYGIAGKQGTAPPAPSGVLRTQFHVSFAKCTGGLEPGLYVTVPELQRYVRHMLCEPTVNLKRAIDEYTEEVKNSRFKPFLDMGHEVEAACQTLFTEDAATQTALDAEKGVAASDNSLERESDMHASDLRTIVWQAGQQLKEGKESHRREHEDVCLLREAEAVAIREAELLKEELLHICDEVRARASAASPSPGDANGVDDDDLPTVAEEEEIEFESI